MFSNHIMSTEIFAAFEECSVHGESCRSLPKTKSLSVCDENAEETVSNELVTEKRKTIYKNIRCRIIPIYM